MKWEMRQGFATSRGKCEPRQRLPQETIAAGQPPAPW